MALSTIDTSSISGLGYGFKNRLINGSMTIDQRNSGASITFNDNVYPVDRFRSNVSQSSKMTAQQNAGSVTPPAGFTNYLGLTSSSAYSVLSTDYFNLCQFIEGYNFADMAWGTASAQPVTLSFWVRSSLTGTFGGSVSNSATNRCYVFSYTINSANTWEYKTVTIAGDTTGTWLTTNNQGLLLFFGLGCGTSVSGSAGSWGSTFYRSVTGAQSVVGTNAATFYITGVQLEKGTVATSFDYRPYGTELALCQRYYYRITGDNFQSNGLGYTTTVCIGNTIFPVTMRAAPSALEQSGTASDYIAFSNSSVTANTVPTFERANTTYAQTRYTVASGLTAGGSYMLRISSPSYLGWSAEL
jgi:hypothetical protein